MWACNPYQIRTPFNGHIEKCEVVTLALHGWAGTGLLHLVQQRWDCRGRSPPRPILAVLNTTAQPLTASVPVAVRF